MRKFPYVLILACFVLAACGGNAATESAAAPTTAVVSLPSLTPTDMATATEEVVPTPEASFATPISENGANLVAYGSSIFFLLDDYTLVGGPKDNFEYERTITEIANGRKIVAVMYYDRGNNKYLVAPIDGNPIKIWYGVKGVNICETEPCYANGILVTGTLVTDAIAWYEDQIEDESMHEIAIALTYWHPAIKETHACIPSGARFGVIHFCDRDESLPLIPSITPTNTSTPTNTPTATLTTVPTSTRTLRPSATPTFTKAPSSTPTPSLTPTSTKTTSTPTGTGG